MFNSQKINNDPFPYVSESGSRHANPGWMGSEYFSNRQERPEFDNNPNPLLLDLRKTIEDSVSSRKTVYRLNNDLLWAYEGKLLEKYPDILKQGHIEHARKVLTRLAALTEEA